MSRDGLGTKRRRKIAENFNRPSRMHERSRQTDGRTDDSICSRLLEPTDHAWAWISEKLPYWLKDMSVTFADKMCMAVDWIVNAYSLNHQGKRSLKYLGISWIIHWYQLQMFSDNNWWCPDHFITSARKRSHVGTNFCHQLCPTAAVCIPLNAF